jgi:hypothetical protein
MESLVQFRKSLKNCYEVNKDENWCMYRCGEYKKDGGYRL